jgi:guanine deaminase
MPNETLEIYMQKAIEEAYDGIHKGDGGPFGSVVVKDGEIIGSGHNMVIRKNDPTVHGELLAIREASQKLNNFDLSGCILVSTGEPSLLSLAACLWANIDKIYYGCSNDDIAKIGFRNEKLDDIVNNLSHLPKNYLTQICHEECLKLFDDYQKMNHDLY